MKAIKKKSKLQKNRSQNQNQCSDPTSLTGSNLNKKSLGSNRQNQIRPSDLHARKKLRLSPYQNLLRDSLMSALGVTSLAGCWQVEAPPCNSPSPILSQQGRETGYSICTEGQMIKNGIVRCQQGPLPSENQVTSPYDNYDRSQGCATHDDCGVEQQCYCGNGGIGQCVPSNCRECGGRCEVRTLVESDDTCGYDPFGSPVQVSLVCLMLDVNECYSNEDCGYGASCIPTTNDQGLPYLACQVDGLESSGFGAICGRPLCTNKTILEADLCEGAAWSDASLNTLSMINQDIEQALENHLISNPEQTTLVKTELLDHWIAIAKLEHSSVASFSRLTLELMALGAPADLLLDTQRATMDEINHAQSALEIVSALHQKPMQFTPFPSAGISVRSERDSILRSCVQEACLGETLGVIEAEGELELMRNANAPNTLIKRLSTVLADESRHAALAWRTLQWLIESDVPNKLEKARRLDLITETLYSTAQKLLQPKRTPTVNLPLVCPSLGLLSEVHRAHLRAQGFQNVVLPVLEGFLGQVRVKKLKGLVSYSLRQLEESQLSA